MLKALLVHKGEIFENVDITVKVAFSKKKKTLPFYLHFFSIYIRVETYHNNIFQEDFFLKQE